MDFSSIESIRAAGFIKYATIEQLNKRGGCKVIDNKPGVYMVLMPLNFKQKYREINPGKICKGKPSSVIVDELKANWVDKTIVLYIGKAGGTGIKTHLRERIGDYMAYGRGTSCNHTGGRYLWQLENTEQLSVTWRVEIENEPVIIERGLIRQFEKNYEGMQPFANNI